jgi:hypothetical protein
MLHRKVLSTFLLLCTAAFAASAVEDLHVLTSGEDDERSWAGQQVVADAACVTCGKLCPVLDEKRAEERIPFSRSALPAP